MNALLPGAEAPPAAYDAAGSLAGVVAAAREAAGRVDRDGAFPAEALSAMRETRMLSALLPARFGGGGLSMLQVASQCSAVGAACASTATILAMHHLQVACLVAHGGDSPWQVALKHRVASEQLLLGSVTSEIGIGGDFRTSRCALVWNGDGFTVEKETPIISYGAQADGLVVTARANPDAEASDQRLFVLVPGEFTLTAKGDWNGTGLRGSGSCPFHLTGRGVGAQLLRDPFAVIATHTMLPVSHLLWSAIWLGIAADAIDRTKRFLKQAFRKSGGATLPAGAVRLADAVASWTALRARTRELLVRYDGMFATGQAGLGLSDTADINLLKVSVSEGCLAIAQSCLQACGFAGYSKDGPFSLDRHLRDLQSGPLMVNNDRIRDNSAKLLLAQLPSMEL